MKIRSNYTLDKEVKEAGNKMAMRDGRSLSAFLNWLVIKEAERRHIAIKR